MRKSGSGDNNNIGYSSNLTAGCRNKCDKLTDYECAKKSHYDPSNSGEGGEKYSKYEYKTKTNQTLSETSESVFESSNRNYERKRNAKKLVSNKKYLSKTIANDIMNSLSNISNNVATNCKVDTNKSLTCNNHNEMTNESSLGVPSSNDSFFRKSINGFQSTQSTFKEYKNDLRKQRINDNVERLDLENINKELQTLSQIFGRRGQSHIVRHSGSTLPCQNTSAGRMCLNQISCNNHPPSKEINVDLPKQSNEIPKDSKNERKDKSNDDGSKQGMFDVKSTQGKLSRDLMKKCSINEVAKDLPQHNTQSILKTINEHADIISEGKRDEGTESWEDIDSDDDRKKIKPKASNKNNHGHTNDTNRMIKNQRKYLKTKGDAYGCDVYAIQSRSPIQKMILLNSEANFAQQRRTMKNVDRTRNPTKNPMKSANRNHKYQTFSLQSSERTGDRSNEKRSISIRKKLKKVNQANNPMKFDDKMGVDVKTDKRNNHQMRSHRKNTEGNMCKDDHHKVSKISDTIIDMQNNNQRQNRHETGDNITIASPHTLVELFDKVTRSKIKSLVS